MKTAVSRSYLWMAGSNNTKYRTVALQSWKKAIELLEANGVRIAS